MESGQAGGLKRSLQFNLALWMSLAVLAFGILASLMAYHALHHRMADLQDTELLRAAFHETLTMTPEHHRHKNAQHPILRRLPVPLGDSSGLGGLAPDLPEGFQDRTVNDKAWRLLVISREDGIRYVAGQPLALRASIARSRAMDEMEPYLLLTLCLGGLVLILVRHFLRPVHALAKDIDSRDNTDLAPLPHDGLPTEIRPFITAINGLLARIAKSAELQRHFVADAAHELRLPLAAISLQAEGLDTIALSDKGHDRLAAMRSGIKRCQLLISQLLAMARAQERLYGESERIIMGDMLRDVLEDLLPTAEAKNIDLGLDQGGNIEAVFPPMALTTILRSLLDNAVRYSPEHSVITVRFRRDIEGLTLCVEDSGPGIPTGEWYRVRDPFYRCLGDRTEGSGLGLAIVAVITENLGGRLDFSHTDPVAASGLTVTVNLPMPPEK